MPRITGHGSRSGVKTHRSRVSGQVSRSRITGQGSLVRGQGSLVSGQGSLDSRSRVRDQGHGLGSRVKDHRSGVKRYMSWVKS